MLPLLIELTVLLLVLACVLVTGSVIARLAVHMRDDAWSRITTKQSQLRHRERLLLDAGENLTCTPCRRPDAAARSGDERKG